MDDVLEKLTHWRLIYIDRENPYHPANRSGYMIKLGADQTMQIVQPLDQLHRNIHDVTWL